MAAPLARRWWPVGAPLDAAPHDHHRRPGGSHVPRPHRTRSPKPTWPTCNASPPTTGRRALFVAATACMRWPRRWSRFGASWNRRPAAIHGTASTTSKHRARRPLRDERSRLWSIRQPPSHRRDGRRAGVQVETAAPIRGRSTNVCRGRLFRAKARRVEAKAAGIAGDVLPVSQPDTRPRGADRVARWARAY